MGLSTLASVSHTCHIYMPFCWYSFGPVHFAAASCWTGCLRLFGTDNPESRCVVAAHLVWKLICYSASGQH